MRKGRRTALQCTSRRRAADLLFTIPLALTIHVSSPARAAADCPPFTAGTSFLEVIALHLPRAGPATDVAIMELVKKHRVSPLLVSPSSGPAPLTVAIRWWVHPVESPLRIEFDVDGNAVPEWSQSGFDPESGQEHYTYQREGQYTFTVRVHARGGQAMVYTAVVKVLARAVFDAELQGRWTTLNAALRRADLPAALDCIHTEARSAFRDDFTALSRRLSQDAARILTPIRFVEHRGGEAEYEMLATDGGITTSYMVLFEEDKDGVWRLRSF